MSTCASCRRFRPVPLAALREGAGDLIHLPQIQSALKTTAPDAFGFCSLWSEHVNREHGCREHSRRGWGTVWAWIRRVVGRDPDEAARGRVEKAKEGEREQRRLVELMPRPVREVVTCTFCGREHVKCRRCQTKRGACGVCSCGAMLVIHDRATIVRAALAARVFDVRLERLGPVPSAAEHLALKLYSAMDLPETADATHGWYCPVCRVVGVGLPQPPQYKGGYCDACRDAVISEEAHIEVTVRATPGAPALRTGWTGDLVWGPEDKRRRVRGQWHFRPTVEPKAITPSTGRGRIGAIVMGQFMPVGGAFAIVDALSELQEGAHIDLLSVEGRHVAGGEVVQVLPAGAAGAERGVYSKRGS